MSDKERAEFESWAPSYFYLKVLRKDESGQFLYDEADSALATWKASAARYQSRIAELEAESARIKELFSAVSTLANSGAIDYDEGHPECALWSSAEMIALREAMKGGNDA